METDRMMSSKTAIRKHMLHKRAQLSPAEVESLSRAIGRKLMELKPLYDAQIVMGYMSIRNEVDLKPVFAELRKKGKTLALPRVEGGEIHPIPCSDPGAMKLSRFGILEPAGPPVEPEKIDAVLVPGLAFDYQGYRIGYGRGYYDRFLPRLRKDAFTCGVCYEFQVVVSVFPHEQDCPVKWIVTERSELMIDQRYF
ncbi:MAG: 5-formyltetrahydrofolate cyclo-ligase [Syntrophomonadaceae bacterium]|jgi:5-formyltetrahydrofolate cyclo-ligase|nr:5-formyltetrahydrofolate cyclo-ligase [Syntrophomonadaceae bacterium]